MAHTPLFTVFTATFIRRRTIHVVHESLLAQTLQNFEWLIVDDGSQYGTAELIEGWAREAPFPIRLIRQENAGKQCGAQPRRGRGSRGAFRGSDSDDRRVPSGAPVPTELIG